MNTGAHTRMALVASAVLAAGSLAACSGSDGDSSAEAVPHVGLMHVGKDHVPSSLDSLTARLEELGWVDGESIKLTWRNLEDKAAAETQADVFVRQGVDLIVAFEDGSIRAAQAATAETQTPVVFLHPQDPVRAELVESLASPQSNLTGVFGPRDLVSKHLERYAVMVPGIDRVLTLVNPEDDGTTAPLEETRVAAKRLGIELAIREVSNASDIQQVFRSLRPGEVDAVIILSPSLRLYFTALTLRLAARAKLPVQAHRKEWVEKGALFSYGMALKPLGTAGARFVDSILDGTPPSELAVEELPEVEFALNLAAARRLGIKIPQEMIILADIVYR